MRDQILQKTDRGLAVFEHYIRGGWQKGRKFRNPAYDDRNAGCSVKLNDDRTKYLFKDFGNERYNGDCFAFVGFILGLDSNNNDDFKIILQTINRDMSLNCTSTYNSTPITNIRTKSKTKVTPPIKQPEVMEEPIKKEYSIKSKEFSKAELQFWGSYGITTTILDRFNVCSLAEFSSISREGRHYTLRSSSSEMMFGYSNDLFIKIYRPTSSLRFVYGGLIDKCYCFGFKQLPPRGDIVFITSGEKDVMSLAARGLSAICFNSETSSKQRGMITILTHRFKHVVLLFDSDDTGKESSQSIVDEYSDLNLKRIELPLSGEKSEKDISDYFRLGHTRQELLNLFVPFLNTIYSDTMTLLQSCEVDYLKPPKPSEDIISLSGVSVGTAGNILCITGSEGTGKSNYVAALLAGCIRDESTEVDTLGATVKSNRDKKAVLFYDTEQSEAQLSKNLRKLKCRAMVRGQPLEFKAFSVTALSRTERLKLITESLDRYNFEFDGIHLVVIDGIADLVRCANDEAESIAVVDQLYKLAGLYNTCIVTVLHFVPNGLKLRGHLGSELQRKAAGILSIERDKDPAISVVKAVKVRDGSALDVPLLQFSWDKELEMHTYIGNKPESARVQRKQHDLKQLSADIFSQQAQITYSDLKRMIQESTGVSDRTSAEYIREMGAEGMITKDMENTKLYVKGL